MEARDKVRLLGIMFLLCFCVHHTSCGYCSRLVCSYRRERVCAYRTWFGCCYYRYRWVPYYYYQQYCCRGYTGPSCNTPICYYGCNPAGGSCTAPNTCSCRTGYEGPRCYGREACTFRKPCFPGNCATGACQCVGNYTGDTCDRRDSSQIPTIWEIRARLVNIKRSTDPNVNGMELYDYNTDSSDPNSNTPDEIWCNQNSFNHLEINGAAEFDVGVLYSSPDYITSFSFGVVSATANIRHMKILSTGNTDDISNKSYPCTSDSTDIAMVWNCTAVERDFVYSISTSDELEMTLIFRSGGYRQVQSEGRQDYNVLSTKKKVIFKFDLEKPEHCLENSCFSSDDVPLFVDKDITRNPVNIRWSGWNDSVSGMYRYAWEVFKLAPYTIDGGLREPNPLEPLVNQEWFEGNTTFPMFIPREPGMYSVILEAADRANNTRYARRVFLYDNTSKITTFSDHDRRLHVSSAADNAGNKWQANLTDGIVVEWSGHFINQVHETGKLLNKVEPYPTQFTDANQDADVGSNFQQKHIDYEDDEGERTLAAIPNVLGIVRFEIAWAKDRGEIDTAISASVRWISVNQSSVDYVISEQNRQNGDSVRVWVRATDIMNNSLTDTTLVSFDETEPTLGIMPPIRRNTHDTSTYSSQLDVSAFDEESGIWEISWRLTGSQGDVRKEGTVDLEQYKRSKDDCGDRCRCTPTGECMSTFLTLPINNCWLNVSKDQLDTEVITMEINATNPAMLMDSDSLQIANLREFRGIGEYFPPAEVHVIREEHNTVRITWNNTPSCYEVSELWVQYTGERQKEKVHRNAEFYDLTGLQPNTNYTAYLITGYNGEMSDPIAFTFTTGPAPPIPGLSVGAKAGVAIGSIILLTLLVFLVFFLLWMFGIVGMARGKERKTKTKKEVALAFRRMSRRHRPLVDDDIYVYGGGGSDVPLAIQLSADRLSLEELITEGKFAKIYRATLVGSGGQSTVVAKMLRDGYNEEEQKLMMGKIKFYSNEVGQHVNILRMIGAVIENEGWGPVMVLEYCEMGPLRAWLVKQKGIMENDLVEKLFRFGQGIASGMTYLAKVGIVHRRLAARNILLTFLLEPRIAGFGPSVMSEDDDNVESARKERVPLRWMAPECFTSTKDATEKSDVWSFGVVLWEIFSLGDNPYPKLRTNEIRVKVKAGHRMSRPELADDMNYDLMQRCWSSEAKKRPKFKDIQKSYERLMSGGPPNMDDYSTYTSKMM